MLFYLVYIEKRHHNPYGCQYHFQRIQFPIFHVNLLSGKDLLFGISITIMQSDSGPGISAWYVWKLNGRVL